MAKRTTLIVAVFAALLSVTLSVQAQDPYEYSWTGSSGGDYWTYTNWSTYNGTIKAPVDGFLGNTTDYSPTNLYIQNSNGVNINLNKPTLGDAVNKLTIGGGTQAATISSGTLTIEADKSIEVLNNGTFYVASELILNANSTVTVSGGTLAAKKITNNGTFTHSGGILTPYNSSGMTITEAYTLGENATLKPNGRVTVSGGSATLNGELDLTVYTNRGGKLGDFYTFLQASSISVSDYTKQKINQNLATGWVVTLQNNNTMRVYYDGVLTNADRGSFYWRDLENGNDCMYTAGNWVYSTSSNGPTDSENSTWVVTDQFIGPNSHDTSKFTRNCYVYSTSKARLTYTLNGETVNGAKIDWSDLGLASLTVGDGTGTRTANMFSTAGKNTQFYVLTSLTVNKGGSVTMTSNTPTNIKGTLTVNGGTYNADAAVNDDASIKIYDGGILNLSSGTLNVGTGGITNPSGDYTINLSGGTFGNNGADWSTSLNAKVLPNTVSTFDTADGDTADGKTITWSGNFTREANADRGTIKKTGAGTLVLDSPSNNSIDCDVIIEQGTVVLSYPDSDLNSRGKNRFTGTVTINEGAKLQCDRGDAIGYNPGAVTFNLYGGELFLNGSNETFQNKTINLKAGTISTTENRSCTFDIFQSGTTFNVEANDTATLENPTTSYVNGWVRLRNKSTPFEITVNPKAKLVFSKDFGISENSSEVSSPLVKLGDGVMVFEGVNTYTQGTRISGGTLVLAENGTLGSGNVENNATLEFAHTADLTGTNAFANVISGTGAVTKTGSGTLELTGANTYSGGTTITAGTLKLTDGGTLGSGNVTNNANLEIATDAGRDFSTVISGTGSLTKTGTGVLRYSGAGTYSGGTNISGGAIRLDPNGSLGSGTINIAAGADLRFAGDLNGITISNTITGAGGLTKQGTGNTVTLSGDLSGFTGTLTTNGENGKTGSTIKLTGANTNLVNASAVVDNGTLDVSGYTGTTTMQLNKLSGAGNVKTGSNAIILNNAANADTTFSGVINGSGSVTKTGAGTLKLTQAPAYTGSTTIEDGTLILAAGGTLYGLSGAGTVSFGSNALTLSNNDNSVFAGALTGSGNVTKTGAGTLTLTQAPAYTGATTIDNGTLILTADSTLNSLSGTASGTLNFGATTLTLNNAANTESTFNGTFEGSGDFIKTGAGELTVTKVFALDGDTTIDDGTLNLTAGGTLNNLNGGHDADGNPIENVSPKIIATGQDLVLSNDEMSKFIGSISAKKITKEGDETLKLYAESRDSGISADKFIVSSGRLDMRGYFEGTLEIYDAVFSPGNSVGALEIGEGTYGGGFILNDAGAELLMEIGGSEIADNDQLTIDGPLTINDGLIYLELSENSKLKPGDEFTALLTASNSSTLTNSLLDKVRTSIFTDLSYEQLQDGTNRYVLRGRFDPNAVPEPSTWALLLLGAAGMMYWRKRKNAK